jgi:hypothetical protein
MNYDKVEILLQISLRIKLPINPVLHYLHLGRTTMYVCNTKHEYLTFNVIHFDRKIQIKYSVAVICICNGCQFYETHVV